MSRWVAGIVAALGISSGVFAQESIEQRLDRLERANAELRQQLQQQQQQISAPSLGAPSPVYDGTVAAQGGAPAAHAPSGAGEAAKDPYYEVGTSLAMNVAWKDGLIFQTANKDFIAHIGGWAQYDNYWLSSMLSANSRQS